MVRGQILSPSSWMSGSTCRRRPHIPAIVKARLMSTLTDEIARPAHLCDHFTSGSRQDHTDREIAGVRRRNPAGGLSQGARRSAAGALGLDGGRAPAWPLGLLGGDGLRARGARLQPLRHAGPPRFDEIEQSLALGVTPVSWPIGTRRDFLGTYDPVADPILLFERETASGPRGRCRDVD